MTTANKIKLVATVLGLLLIVIVILQNMEQATTNILFAQIQMPRSVLLLVTLLIGFGAGAVTVWIYQSRRKQ